MKAERRIGRLVTKRAGALGREHHDAPGVHARWQRGYDYLWVFIAGVGVWKGKLKGTCSYGVILDSLGWPGGRVWLD